MGTSHQLPSMNTWKLNLATVLGPIYTAYINKSNYQPQEYPTDFKEKKLPNTSNDFRSSLYCTLHYSVLRNYQVRGVLGKARL